MSGKRMEILRVEKVKGAGSLKAMLRHSFRERETLNAVPEQLERNTVPAWAVGDGVHHPAGEVTQDHDSNRGMGRWREMTEGCSVQKNSVWALEYVVTASPEEIRGWTPEKAMEYLQASRDYLVGRHLQGGVFKPEEVELGAFFHFDESTPHMHLFIVPKVQKTDRFGKPKVYVGAKDFVDGSEKLSKLQTSFHESVGKGFNLNRGIEGSSARHSRVKRFYGLLESFGDREMTRKLVEFAVSEGISPVTLTRAAVTYWQKQTSETIYISRDDLPTVAQRPEMRDALNYACSDRYDPDKVKAGEYDSYFAGKVAEQMGKYLTAYHQDDAIKSLRVAEGALEKALRLEAAADLAMVQKIVSLKEEQQARPAKVQEKGRAAPERSGWER